MDSNEIDTLIKLRHPDPKTDAEGFVESLPLDVIESFNDKLFCPGLFSRNALITVVLNQVEDRSTAIEMLTATLKEYYAAQ